MNADKYSKKLKLCCSTCGGDQFKYDLTIDENVREYTCEDCGRVFSHEEILEENGEIIDDKVQEIGDEFIKDAQKEINDSLKKAFKGNKFIKFK